MKKHLHTVFMACTLLLCTILALPVHALEPPTHLDEFSFSTSYNKGVKIRITYNADQFTVTKGMQRGNDAYTFIITEPEDIHVRTKNLTQLNIGHNGITRIHLTYLTKLKRLFIADNHLVKLDLSNSNLNTLEWVNASQNNLTTLKVESRYLTNLETLNLSSNCLEEYPITKIIEGLHNRKGKSYGKLILYNTKNKDEEFNLVVKEHATKAKAKNWYVYTTTGGEDYSSSNGNIAYPVERITLKSGQYANDTIKLSVWAESYKIVQGLKALSQRGMYKVTDRQIILEGKCITRVMVDKGEIYEVDLKQCHNLRGLGIENNYITQVDVKHLKALGSVYLRNNLLNYINLEKNYALYDIEVSDNSLSSLPLPTRSGALVDIRLYGNFFTNAELEKICNVLPTIKDKGEQQIYVIKRGWFEQSNGISKALIDKFAAINWKCMDNGLKYLDSGYDDIKFYDLKIKFTKYYKHAIPASFFGYMKPYENIKYMPMGENNYVATSQSAQIKTVGIIMLNMDGCDLQEFNITGGDLMSLSLKWNSLRRLDLSKVWNCIRIDVTGNDITELILPPTDRMSNLDSLVLCYTNITEENMGRVVNALPDRTKKDTPGKLLVASADVEYPDLTTITPEQIKQAKAKNWRVLFDNLEDYDPNEYYSVTVSTIGEGKLRITGCDNLNKVLNGTELTVETYDVKTGWELSSLMAGKEDILGTRKFNVYFDTKVEGIFTKKKFAVTMQQEGKGIANILGSSDLSKVNYGTKLTVSIDKVEPGWKLEQITANGKDITATKEFTVTENTVVKVIFKELTAVDPVSGQATQIKRVDAEHIELFTHQAGSYKLFTMGGELLSSGALTGKQVVALPMGSHAILQISYATGQTATYKL